jgi:hypothetical protein
LEINTQISNPWLLTVVFLSVSAAITYAIYFFKRNSNEFSQSQRKVLSSIKFLYLLLISFLLLSPLIEIIRNRIEKPLIIIGIDNSGSMGADSLNYRNINNFITEAKNQLGGKYQMETLLFGERTIKSDSITFTDLRSDYSNFIYESEKRYYNLNVGAFVIVGDGIFNEGKNPEQLADRINAPVYTLGVGDTLNRMDQAIIDVTHNPNVFKGNAFPVEVELSFTDFPLSSTQLSIFIDGKVALSEKIEVLQPNYYFRKTHYISTNEVGLKNVSVLVSPLKDEQNIKNNRYNFTIEVHETKKNILFLSQGPHPDIGAITETLNQKANYNISSVPIAVFNGDINQYDLVVLNQLPSLMTQQNPLYAKIKESKTPILLIVGPNTSIAALNNLEVGFSLNPTLMTENVEPFFNELFPLFSIPSNIKDIESIYPPLIAQYSEYKFNSDLSVLAYQRIKGIEMNYPLMLAGSIDNRKVGAIMGEGIWRWRLREFQYYDNHNVFNHIIVNLFNYLTLKEERDQFRLTYERISNETTPFRIKAQVFNDIFEPITNAEVSFSLIDSTGNEMSYLFDVSQAEYHLNLGLLSPGTYRFEAMASLGENIWSKNGVFNVQEVNIEQQNLKSNFSTLLQISTQTGGDFYTIDRSEKLIDQLKNQINLKPRLHKEKSISELIDWKWLVLIIFFLLSLEWFLRKYWGSY